ncbi:MAG: hypothetical protein HUJ84_04810, partial [Veillonella sp.]|nr:hypothetical protein [Veillonella sp.]
MNKIYKVVWSKTKNMYVVASEIAKTNGKASSSAVGTTVRALAVAALLTGGALGMSQVYADTSSYSNHPVNTAEDLSIAINPTTGVIDSGSKVTAKNGSVAIGYNDTAESTSVALGKDNTAQDHSVAIGGNNTAVAKSIAIGSSASVANTKDTGSIAIGNNATVATTKESNWGAHDSVAIGTDTTATGMYNVAMGHGAQALNTSGTIDSTDGQYSRQVAIGNDAQAFISDTEKAKGTAYAAGGQTAIGAEAQAHGQSATAIGEKAQALQRYTFAAGMMAVANGENAVSVGVTSHANADNTAVFGGNSWAMQDHATALGADATAYASTSIAVGASSRTDGVNSIGIGSSAYTGVYAKDAIAVGTKSDAESLGAIAIGSSAVAKNADGVVSEQHSRQIAIGTNAQALGTTDGGGQTAVGAEAYAHGQSATALGEKAYADGKFTTAVGMKSKATGEAATAVGFSTVASGYDSMALGSYAEASGLNSVSIGTSSAASGKQATVIGADSKVTGDNSAAVGTLNEVTTAHTYVLGDHVTSTLPSSVYLGAHTGTVAGDATTEKSPTGGVSNYSTANIANVEYKNFAGGQPVGVVSVGSADGTQTRRIQGVSAGLITADSTDAINGSQLYSVANTITTELNKGLSFDGNSGNTVNRKLGQTLNIVGEGTGNVAETAFSSATGNIGVFANGKDTLTVELNSKLTNLSSATFVTPDGTTTINGGGLSITGGPSVTKDGI